MHRRSQQLSSFQEWHPWLASLSLLAFDVSLVSVFNFKVCFVSCNVVFAAK